MDASMVEKKLIKKEIQCLENLEKGNTNPTVFCRTCLKTNQLRPLFGRNDHEGMSVKLKLATGLEIYKDDNLSQMICNTCIRVIDFVIRFRTKSKQAEEALIQMMANQKNNIDPNLVRKLTETCPFIEVEISRSKTPKTKENIYKTCIKIEPLDHTSENNSQDDQVLKIVSSEEDISLISKYVLLDKKLPKNLVTNNREITIKKVPVNFEKENPVNEPHIVTLSKNSPDVVKGNISALELTTERKRKYVYQNNSKPFMIRIQNLPPNWDQNQPKGKSAVTNPPQTEYIHEDTWMDNDDSKQNELEKHGETEIYNEIEKCGEIERHCETERYSEIERHSETERYSEIERHSETERYSEIERHSETERYSEIERHAKTERYSEIKRHAETEIYNKIERCGEIERHGEMEKQSNLEKHDELERFGEAENYGISAQYNRYKDPTNQMEQPIIKVDNLPPNWDKKQPYYKKQKPPNLYIESNMIEINSESGHPLFKCKFCGKQYATVTSYRHHVVLHSKSVVCELCGKKWLNRQLLLTHQRAVHGLEKIHKCTVEGCDAAFARKEQLQGHSRRHNNERPYVCDTCGAGFFARSTLAQHLGTHMQPTIQCPHCPLKLKSQKLLSNHKAQKHGKRYRYICPICQKEFGNNKYTHRHLLRVHGLPTGQHPHIDKRLVA